MVSGLAKALSIPPGEYAGNGETQRNCGGPHKRRNMWFNSMIREEPYPGLELQRKDLEIMTPFGVSVKVLHGCRQLVP